MLHNLILGFIGAAIVIYVTECKIPRLVADEVEARMRKVLDEYIAKERR